MPSSSTESFQPAVNSSFIGLKSYTEEQADSFFGRDAEIDNLTNLVKSNTLTIVFGKSGIGKTSLLNAGVFPKLRQDFCLPFRIRLEFQDNSPDLVSQIKQVLKEEIDKYGFEVTSYPGSETLWEYFHKELLWKTITPVLIFDQFEEMFTLAKKSNRFGNKELELFWQELSDLAENSIPEKLKDEFLNHKENIGYNYKNQKIKILFAFREEYLPEFESITPKIPSIKYSRFRLMPMNGNQAYEVITQTWNTKIDTAQANKIVGFFTNEDGTKQTYDVMEIEPSLLSQVCSYIDKERITAGNDKISAEFLSKYPKETILRSIYNEALIESNNAVNRNEDELKKMLKPVNVFVEDKLITDEGYRSKYAVIEIEEKIKPGVEVLKRKYFLREDANSIELTHDVLVPLIKTDRETRRKKIAVEAARKRANRRALFIIILSAIAAIFIWYFIAGKAIQDKKDAIQYRNNALDSTQKLIGQLKQDSIKLKSIQDSIKNLRNGKKTDPKSDTSHLTPAEKNKYDSTLMELQKQYANIKKQYDDLKDAKAALDNINGKLNARVNSLSGDQSKTESENNELKKNIGALSKLKHDDSIEFKKDMQRLRGDYDLLKRIFDEYKLKYPPIPRPDPNPYPPYPPPNPTPDVPETNGLQLNLYYSTPKNKRVPGNLKIYLIPDSSYNKKIIRKAMLYEIRCDELQLDSAKGKQIATFANKKYSFHNVVPGKYFIKICAYYGGYYPFTKKVFGNTTTQPLDLSPPIR